MRIVVLILALFGAGGGAAIAMNWISDYDGAKATIAMMDQASPEGAALLADLNHLRLTAFVWVGCAVLGLIGGILALRRKGRIAAAVLALAVIVPAVMSPKTLLTGGLFALAALLALLVKPQTEAPRPLSVPGMA